jgi:DNA mismatch endonuclease (patch repair protein)
VTGSDAASGSIGTDIMPAEARSRLMARIGGRNTKPEVSLRKALFRLGFRYRLHPRDIPGRPDMVFPRWRAAVFVHGCFWHGHDCHLFRWPKGNAEFWQAKISGNVERDRRTLDTLVAQGWRVLIVWECAMRGRHRLPVEAIAQSVADWLASDQPSRTTSNETNNPHASSYRHPGKGDDATLEP